MSKRKKLRIILSVVAVVILIALFVAFFVLKDSWKYSAFLLVIAFAISAGLSISCMPDV